jgi:hypothetical protein
MRSVTHDPPRTSMSDQPTDLTARLKRDVGLHRAAQTLADAWRCREQLRPVPLNQLEPEAREWFKQTARHLIELFEVVTADREPESEREAREIAIVRMAHVRERRMVMERALADGIAADRGHDLNPWAPVSADGTIERAACSRCARIATIDIRQDPTCVSGPAVTEGCLFAAVARPDAFLAGRPDSAREEDR